MVRKLYKALAILPLVFAITASASCSCPDDEEMNLHNQGHGMSDTEMMGAYNAPARIDVQGSWDVYITGSFIYWEAREQGLDLGIVGTIPTDSSNHVKEIDFDYKPGFKVGLGTNLSHDNWTLYLEWTRIHGSTSTHEDIDVSVYTDSEPTWFWPTTDTYAATRFGGKWNNKYDMLDLELGRPYYLGTKLTVKPHFGARWGWIRQKLDAQYYTASGIDTSANKSKSWLLGPRAGFDGNWIFGHGFRLIGNAATSVFYQRLKTSHVATTYAGVVRENLSKTYGMYNPYLEMAAGLGWGTYFSNNGWHFDVSALWEHHNFWNQNTMSKLNSYDASPRFNGEADDLTYSGLTVTLRLDF